MPRPPALRGGRRQPRRRPPSPCRSARSGARRRTARRCGCAARRASRRRHLAARAAPFGSSTSRMQPQLLVGRQRGSRARRRRSTSSKPVAATTSSTVTPGCTERSRMRWSGVSKSSTAEVGDDPADLVEARRDRPELGGPVVADAATHVDLLDEHAWASGWGSSSWSVWLIVLPGAPRTPSSWAFGLCQSPMQAMFWLPYRSIWLAPIITWRGRPRRMSKTVRYGIQPSTTLGGRPPSGRVVGRRSMASPSVSSRSGSKVARASRAPSIGMVPIGLAQDLAVAAQRLGAGRRTQTSARRRRRSCAPRRSRPLAGSRLRRQSRYRSVNACPRLGSAAAVAYSFWNASSRP